MGQTKKHQARFGLTAAEVGRLFEAQENKCQKCGRSDVTLGIDHVIPISRGGSDDPSNLQILCRPCNSRKGNRNVTDYRSAPVTIVRDVRKPRTGPTILPNGDIEIAVRFPSDIYASIKERAKKDDRSINYIIVKVLRSEFGEDDTPAGSDSSIGEISSNRPTDPAQSAANPSETDRPG